MKILLGVSGGIAVYKAAELTRELRRRGFDVQVAMTEAAQRFVTPLTFAALSAHPVLTSIWQPTVGETSTLAATNFDIEHTSVAQEIAALVIAPATANTLARLAHGIADDPLSTIALATRAPLFVAPAMNVNMWHHPATQHNVQLLRSRGVHVIEPESGSLACGAVGEGRLAEPKRIADQVSATLRRARDLEREHLLITAGGTREPIDPVRYLGNRSSGRMGHSLAEVALQRGAHVTLITAAHPPSLACNIVRVNTAADMRSAVLAHLPGATGVIMAAAVADFRPVQASAAKIKKTATLKLELIRNEDILQRVCAERSPGTIVIGFAAETSNLIEEARRKLHEKNLDAIVANDVSSPDSGFDADLNSGVFLTPGREIELPLSTKHIMAERILDAFRALRKDTGDQRERSAGIGSRTAWGK